MFLLHLIHKGGDLIDDNSDLLHLKQSKAQFNTNLKVSLMIQCAHQWASRRELLGMHVAIYLSHTCNTVHYVVVMPNISGTI